MSSATAQLRYDLFQEALKNKILVSAISDNAARRESITAVLPKLEDINGIKSMTLERLVELAANNYLDANESADKKKRARSTSPINPSSGLSKKYQSPMRNNTTTTGAKKRGTLGPAVRTDGMERLTKTLAKNKGGLLKYQYGEEEMDEIKNTFAKFSWEEYEELSKDINSLDKLLEEVDFLCKHGADPSIFASAGMEEVGDALTLRAPTNPTEVASALVFVPSFRHAVGKSLFYRMFEKYLANDLMARVPRNLESAMDKLTYIKENYTVMNRDTVIPPFWQAVVRDILQKPDMIELKPFAPPNGFNCKKLYARLLVVKKSLVIQDVVEEEEVDDEECANLEKNLELRKNMLKAFVKFPPNARTLPVATLHVATGTADTGSSTVPIRKEILIRPFSGHPNFVPTSGGVNANQALGFSVTVVFGSEDLKQSFVDHILKRHTMSYMTFLDKHIALDETSDSYATDKAAIKEDLLNLMMSHILSSDPMARDILAFANADHDSITATESDVCFDSDNETAATKTFNKNVEIALKDTNVLDGRRCSELVNDIYSKVDGRFLIQVEDNFLLLPRACAISYIYQLVYRKTGRVKNRNEALQKRLELASMQLPKDQTHIEGNLIVDVSTNDGLKVIEECVKKSNPDNLPAYVGEGLMGEDGTVMRQEDTKFITDRCKIVLGNGKGLLMKHLAFHENELGRNGKILLVKRSKLAALHGGASSKAAENHGITLNMQNQDVLHLNYGLYGRNSDSDNGCGGERWHLLYHTLLVNLRDLLSRNELFLFVGNANGTKNVKNDINMKLQGEGQIWISYDPRIRHTRVSTKTGKVKVYYTLVRED